MKTIFINFLTGIVILAAFVQCNTVTSSDSIQETEERITSDLLSPINNATDQSTEVELQWDKIRGGKEYQIRLSEEQSLDSLIVETSVEGTSFTTPTLEEGSTYYWQVKPLARNGYWSEVWHFTTSGESSGEQTSSPPSVTLISPDHGANDLTLPVTFEWDEISGIDSYQIQIAEENSFSTLITDEAVAGISYESTQLETGKTYYWRVQSNEDGDTGNWSTIRSLNTGNSSTPAVTLLSPSDGASDRSTTVTLEWEALSGISSYRIQLGGSDTFSSPVIDETVSSTSHEVSGLNNSQTYYWRVQATGDEDTGNWSTVFSFITVNDTKESLSDSRAGDEAALEAIYTSTEGASWGNNTGWSSSGINLSNSMYGVTTATIDGDLRVTELRLGFNNLTGELPNEIGNLKELKWFNVKQNNLTGEIPAEIGLPKLEVLILAGNPDYDHAPTYHGNLLFVQNQGKELPGGNDFSGTIPDVFDNLPILKTIELSGTSITGTLPSTFTQATAMQVIYMSWNDNFGGEIPSDIGNQMTDLYQMAFFTNNMTGEVPSSLNNCPNLYALNISNRDRNRGTNTFHSFPDLSATNIDFLYLSRNSFSQEFPAWIVGDNGPRHIDLTWNQYNGGFTGTIPEFSANVNFVVFVVDGNELTGSLPASINDNPGLIQLGVSFNNMDGPLPDISKLGNLRFAYFNHNSFTGTVPPLPAGADDLTLINFRGNQMSGFIDPARGEVAKFPKMGTGDFNISSNAFADADMQDLIEGMDADGNLHVLNY